jgi:hypothetical protein
MSQPEASTGGKALLVTSVQAGSAVTVKAVAIRKKRVFMIDLATLNLVRSWELNGARPENLRRNL